MNNLNKKRVLFSDLDDTLIHTISGKTFPEDCSDFRIDLKVLDKIKEVLPNLEYLFIVSNQSGISKGYVDEDKFTAKYRSIMNFIFCYFNTSIIVDMHYCPNGDPKDVYRKPNTGMLSNLINLHMVHNATKEEMLMIGDASGNPGDWSDYDKKTAENFGIDYIDVKDFLSLE